MHPDQFIDESRRPKGRAIARAWRGLITALGIIVLTGAGPFETSPPEVVRVRIPSKQVTDWFPADTPLRLMPPSDFETLLKTAADRSRAQAWGGARLIRARHFARFSSGLLKGKSELTVASGPGGPSSLSLEPWSPAIVADAKSGGTVGASAAGKTVVWLEPPTGPSMESTISVEWELRARPDSRGRIFGLALPGDATSTLTLDVPQGWEPSGPSGYRQGPLPGTEAERATWQFHGRLATLDLRLVNLAEKREAENQPHLWVSGPTRISLSAADKQEPRPVNWTTEWTIQADTAEIKEFSAVLDPGIELLGVDGSNVRAFHLDPDPATRRVTVVLAENAQTPSMVRFQAHALIPTEGTWSVPAIRPMQPAVWTGGATTIVLDEHHTVRECRERDGRRIPPTSNEPGAAAQLVFESVAPGPVADLTFRSPSSEFAYAVRGRVFVSEATTRLECEFTGLGTRGSVPEHDIEIPPNWVLDRVQVSGIDEGVSWNQSVRSDGSTLLRVLVPPVDGASEKRTLTLNAASSIPPGQGPFALPRIRLMKGTIADEAWAALVDGQTQLLPVSTSGLAWIDPSQVPGLLPPLTPTSDLRPSLGWRWTAESTEAVVDRRRTEQGFQGWVYVKARIEEQGRRLIVEGRITVATAPEGLDKVPIWIEQSAQNLETWTFLDATTGTKIEPIALTEPARRKLGMPRSGVALELAGDPAATGRTAIDYRAEFPWNNQGRIPLPCLPNSFTPRGVVVIEIPHRMRSRIKSEGLRRIEPTLAGRLAPGPATRAWPSIASASAASTPYWTAQALTYSDQGCRLDLTTEELTPGVLPGLIREARLTTQVFPDGRSLNRLRMVVGVDQLAGLRFKTPDEAVLARLRLDGQDVSPTIDEGRLSIPSPRDRGEGTRTIEMDYHTKPDPSASARGIRPAVPDFGLPCVSFCWELILPVGEGIDRPGPEFVVNTVAPRPPWPFGVMGFPRLRWLGERGAARPLREDTVRWLDEQLISSVTGGLTFAEWFTRWDSGAYPVVIDRTSLSDEAVGPRSRCVPAQRDPMGLPVSTRTLQQNGLALLIIDDALVITSQREAASIDAASSWRSSVAEALFWGGDKTDRFQSVARWRGESSSSDLSDRQGRLPGWSSWHLSASHWPSPDAQVLTTSTTMRTVSGWLVAVVVVGLSGLRQGRSLRRDLIAPLLLMTLAVIMQDWFQTLSPPVSAGLFLGALGILLVRLGRILHASLTGPVGGSHSASKPLPFLKGSGLRITALWIVAAVLILPSVHAMREGEKPIIALIPYEGVFDPTQPASRIILRQEDHERLAKIAQGNDVAGGLDLAIIAADHRVTRTQEQEIVVISDYTIKTGGGSAPFEFPVSGARDIQATIDDQATPIVITPGGESGVVTLASGRISRLRLRRTAIPTRDGATEVLDLRINPTPLARLTLEQPSGFRPVQQLSARGKVVAKGDQTIDANLGPMDRIEVCWTMSDSVVDQPSASVESLVLWDLDPAGERVRARLTYRTRRRTSTIRIALEPGLTPRAIQVPGLVDTSWGGTPQNPEWIARVDPPIPDRTTIVLDFWRPLQGGAGANSDAGDSTRIISRRFPRMEPLGVDRDSGLLAVRRPGHWTGRLETIQGAEPVGDESFVRAWGALPDDLLTFAGTVRFNTRDVVEFRTGPSSTRFKLKPSAQLRIDSGRIDCQFESELTEITGLLDHVDLNLPDDLIVVDVESAGMTDWSRATGKPLQVRFDRIDLKSRRTIKIKGWIPVTQSNPNSGPRQYRTRLPWIGADDVAGSPGTLVVLSKGTVELTSAAGGAATLSAGTSENGESGGPWSRQVYQIEDPAKVGELRWTPAPARVNVLVASQLTIHPDSVEWVAVLRYDVAGGALDAIHLRVPAIWAAHSQLQLTGQDHQLTTESRDQSTFWSITPERPIWGSQRVVLRSSMPIASEQEIVFPEITPLGSGVVDGYLGLVFATASPPTTERVGGLRPIVYASRFHDAEFGGATGMATRAYHVEPGEWSLKVQAPPHADAALALDDQSARVKSTDLSFVLTPDGSILGRANYQTEPRTGQFLTIEPSVKSVLTWTTVDGSAVTPLLAEEGKWIIPLGEQSTKLVNVLWTEKADGFSVPGSPYSLILPRAGEGRTPSLVSVHLPPEAALRPSLSGLEPVGPERLDLERADRVAQRITGLLAEMDRGSGRDRERLASLLINHELALRSAEHVLQAVTRGTDRAQRDRASRELDVIQASRAAVVEAVRSTGLEEQIEAARIYLGLAQKDENSQAQGVPEQTNDDRIRRLGKPTFLVGSTPGLQEPAARIEVFRENLPWRPGASEDRARSLLLLVFLFSLGLAGLTTARSARTQAIMVLACLVLAAVAGGPLALAACTAVVLAGWFHGFRARPLEAVG